MKMSWVTQDALAVSPLFTLVCLVLGVRYVERRLKAPEVTTPLDAPPIEAEGPIAPPVDEMTARDWGELLSYLLNEMTRGGFVALPDEREDQIVVAPRDGMIRVAKVAAQENGSWRLK